MGMMAKSQIFAITLTTLTLHAYSDYFVIHILLYWVLEDSQRAFVHKQPSTNLTMLLNTAENLTPYQGCREHGGPFTASYSICTSLCSAV